MTSRDPLSLPPLVPPPKATDAPRERAIRGLVLCVSAVLIVAALVAIFVLEFLLNWMRNAS